MMICYLCKTLVNETFAVKKPIKMSYLSLFWRPISTIPKPPSKNSSFTVNYLVNSCGLSPKYALSASKLVHIETPEKPDSVLGFFRNHNFTGTQISNIVKRYPRVILIDPELTLLPTFNFFHSIGLSSTDLTQILTSTPIIFRRSLSNRIIPSFTFLKNLVEDNERIITLFKRYPRIFLLDSEAILAPNMAILREFGVPVSNILTLLTRHPRTFVVRSDLFRQHVEEVKGMGFNPSRMRFLLAVFALRSVSKMTWKRKVEVYKKWNLSDKEILVAFGKFPGCMTASEDKIMAVMDYFVNTMGWKPLVIIDRPVLLSLSMEKRIVPRCAVVQVLLSKGLIWKKFNLSTMLGYTEKSFLKKFVIKYEDAAPELLKLYKEQLNLGIKGKLG